MPLFVFYLFKLSVSVAIIWLFYALFLRKLTFYSMNRWYLLGYSVLSFLIPFINIAPLFGSDHSDEPAALQFIPSFGNYPLQLHAETGVSDTGPYWKITLVLMAAGAGILLIRTVLRWVSLVRVRKQSRLIRDMEVGIGIGEVKIYQLDERTIPFSFGNAIYMNDDGLSEKERAAIILHEYVHIRQRHTADVLLAELLCIVNWYNPFAWLIRYSIRQNLEFIADKEVLASGLDKKNYQYHLLKVLGEPGYRLSNHFNFSSLKKRIIMMNKIRSARLQLIKFLFILPLIAVLLLAFRHKYKGAFRPKPDPMAAAMPILMSMSAPATMKNPQSQTLPGGSIPDDRPATGNGVTTRAVMADTRATGDQPGAAAAGLVAGRPVFGQPAGQGAVDNRKGFLPSANRSKDTVPSQDTKVVIVKKSTVENKDTSLVKAGVGQQQAGTFSMTNVLKVVDGVQMPADWDLKAINPDQIYSINVLKDGKALQFYGEAGANGVIVITTKAFQPRIAKADSSHAVGMVHALDKDGFRAVQPLIIVDGKEMPGMVMEKLNADLIESVNVLKGKSATDAYGDKGSNGVMIIVTKHGGIPVKATN